MSAQDSAVTRPAAAAPQKAAKKAPGIRQTMSDLHIWAGLLVGWLLYVMFLTGTVSYFKEEISQWMRPELAHQSTVPDPALVATRVVQQLQTLAPDSPQWSFSLPDARSNIASAFWRKPGAQEGRRGAFGNATFDPATGDTVKSRETRGGDFFYRFHFQFHYMPVLWGRWLAGFCAMFMLVAIVSGVITHKKIFIDFFTFRWGKGQRSWLDAHNALSVFGLPFHAMITYTGLVTLMLMYMPWGQNAAYTTPAERQAAQRTIFSQPPQVKPSGELAELAPIADMVRQAQARWGRDNLGRVTVANPGDANARVTITRGSEERVSTTTQFMHFEGSTGRLLQATDQGSGGAAETRGVMVALHLGHFADPVVRWLYFLVSLAGTAMVGTGLVLWTVKRRAKLPDPDKPYFGFWLVERLNIAAIAGLSIAMAGMLWANRLLPLDLGQRGVAEVNAFFAVWGATLVWALVRPAKRAWIELLWAGAAVLALLPVVNALTTDRPLWRSLASGDWVFGGLELTLFALALLHVALALRTARHRPKARPVRPTAKRPVSPTGPTGRAAPAAPAAPTPAPQMPNPALPAGELALKEAAP
ncbi:peptidase [Comamonas serinivorans]|uniref:Peptidase n=1 Tax=Comamonas serinivorans TaxID=1082851 RepID=A0A1Y0ENE0_9BURK|nr:PepSY-associated TM helix domain-containing protein [Comamonas serinivorans]ARU05165.1 peptidase [Comamonas serinivorans]